mmetsp:Transcript_41590/g.81271  ORF Transcript_41590/g.81271 Transcript_41590/m.81271 type:complete len:280 (-) Transcript_41590:39-878(-)
MPKRPRSRHIGPAALELIDRNTGKWFCLDPNEAGTLTLMVDLMPHFIMAGLAGATNSDKAQRNSIRRAITASGYTVVAAGVGRGHSVFSPGARWTLPAPSVSSATRHLPSSLSSCVRCVACFKTPDVAPMEHRQCQRGHSLCDECFEGMPAPSKARCKGASSTKYNWCPKKGCGRPISGDGFRNLVVEDAFSKGQVQTSCPLCLDDFSGHIPIIQCKTGHCMCLSCYDTAYADWAEKRKQVGGGLFSCPTNCGAVLACITREKGYRNKAAEYLFAHKFV